jgi:uncharacterized protein (TIGR04255 family)
MAVDELPPPPPNPVTFERPPVAEVALAVQFAQPVADDTFTLGRFWPKIAAHFPHLEPQPPLPPMGEQFGEASLPPLSFQIFSRPPSGRYWFLSEDRAELVQVQPDRFAFNWRKEPNCEVEYPRYRHLRERFFGIYSRFVESCHEAGREVLPHWGEVTYINQIEVDADGGWPDLSTVLRRLTEVNLELGPPESTTLNERYLLLRGNDPYGRFHVTAEPARRLVDNHPLFVVTLVARGRLDTKGIVDVVEFLDEGRNLIVTNFRNMTTDQMHKVWGLRDAG